MKTTEHEKAVAVEPMVICARCGSDKGYNQKVQIRQWVSYDKAGMNPGFEQQPLSVKRYGAKRCIKCDKRI